MGLFSMNGNGLFLVSSLLLLSTVVYSAPSLQDVLGSRDQDRLRSLFGSHSLDSLDTVYYVARGVALLGGDNKKIDTKICSYLKSSKVTTSQEYFYVSSTLAVIKGCDHKLANAEKALNNMLNSEERNTTEVYWIASSLTNLGKALPKSLSVSNLVALIDKEEGVSRYGHAFMTGSLLKEKSFTGLTDLIEDAVAQGDEAGQTLYFEGGLSVTSDIITGIIRLAEKANTKPTLTSDQATYFGNYILSSKDTDDVMLAFYMLQAAHALANNKFVVPTGLLRTDYRNINTEDNTLKLRLSNVLGGTVGQCTVTLKTVQDPSGKQTTVNKPLKADSNGLDYTASLSQYTGTAGSYVLILSTEAKADSPVVSLSDVKIKVAVSFTVTVESAVLAVIEKEQNVAVKSLSLSYPKATGEVLVADQQSKVKMTFDLLNKANKEKVSLHQTFVRLVSQEGEEIFFVATPDADKSYVFELDIAKTAKDSFNSKSGTYDMTLVVGGATVQNPFTWDIGKLTLKFSGTPKVTTSEEQEYRYKPRPEIQHMFQKPEKLPPSVVSLSFSALVLLPLAVLVILWLILGVNFSNITVSGHWGLIFHGGLIGIFLLYYCFWTNMNMFQTLKWLALLGGVTVVAGNQMLRRIAKSKVN